MTMRERLIRAMQESPAWPAVFQAGTADALLDAILAELMEPGEGMKRAALNAMTNATVAEPKAAAWDAIVAYRAMLTHIREER